MSARDTSSAFEALSLLPPFRAFPGFKPHPKRLVDAHLAIVVTLYAIFLAIAFAEGMIWNDTGIGILENPPFFAHFLVTTASVPLVAAIARRATLSFDEIIDQPNAQEIFLSVLGESRFAWFIYGVTVLVGIIALAASIVMAASFVVDVYDSTSNFPTFLAYTLVRFYQYLICYPLLVATPAVLAILYFVALRRTNVRYEPFDPDYSGGLKKYLRVFDRPFFIIQSLTVLIAVANYLGWGQFGIVPTVLAVGAPTVATSLAVTLYLSFHRLARALRDRELLRIGVYQNDLYRHLLVPPDERSRPAKELIDEIEANERLAVLIRERRNWGWVKYALNYLVAIAPHILNMEITTNFLNQLGSQSIGS
ncbi:hypothetical protein [Afifella sp. YEN Y35]|uniref:hypothetical protein n=1 Tax=Afifella sp. YEN Y35 TaxID=3388337 RepID=UPI0039E0A2E5